MAWSARALQVDQRVGQDQILLAHHLVVVPDILLELGAIVAEEVARGGHRHQAHVEKIRRPSHIPQETSAQRRIMLRRASRSAAFCGAMNDRPTGSPVVGDL